MSNLSRVLTHLDLKLTDMNNNSVVFLNCLINLKYLDLSLNPKLSDYGISKMLVQYFDNDENEEEYKDTRMCYENLEMLNLSYNPLITDQFMFKYCEKFKSLRVLEVSNTSISTVGISFFLKQQKNKWGLLESNYPLFDEYNDKSHLNPFEDYYNNSYDTYHKDKNYLKNPIPNMICKPVKPIKIDIENLKYHHNIKIISEKQPSSTIINNDKNEGMNENENEEDIEETLLYNSVFRDEECYMEDRPSFNWHENRKVIKQNTLNYIWKLFRKIPLNVGVIRFNNNKITTVQLQSENQNKRGFNSISDDKSNNSKVFFKKPKHVKNNSSDGLGSMIKDILH